MDNVYPQKGKCKKPSHKRNTYVIQMIWKKIKIGSDTLTDTQDPPPPQIWTPPKKCFETFFRRFRGKKWVKSIFGQENSFNFFVILEVRMLGSCPAGSRF